MTSDVLTATAVSTAPGNNCPPGGTDPRCTPVTQVLIPALTITKTATATTPTPGSAVGYTITVADTGQSPYTDAAITDALSGVLDDASYDNDAVATTGSVSYASPDLTWTGDLNPGGTATITYTVTVNDPDTGDKQLTNTVTSATVGSTCPVGTSNPACTATIAVASGALTIAVAPGASLGSAAPGGILSASLGTVQVTDDRGFGAGWTATVSATNFTTGTATSAETIPASDAFYDITALSQTTGTAAFTYVPVTDLTETPQAVAAAADTAGNTAATWDPIVEVTVPASAIAGSYTATITYSVSLPGAY